MSQPVPKPKSQERHSTAFIELVVLGVLGVVFVVLTYYFDLFDVFTGAILKIARPFNADEIVMGIAFLIWAAAFFSYRRWREAKAEVAQARATDAALQRLVADQERLVQERTRALTTANNQLQVESQKHQEAQAEVEAREQRFRVLLENSADAISLLAPDGTLLYDSPAAPRMLGYEPDELLGFNAFNNIHPDDLAQTTALLQQLVAQPQSRIHGEFRFKHRNGSWRWIQAVASNLLAEPSVQALVVNYQDATERKNIEENLARERNLLRTVIDNLPDQIFVKDRQSRFLVANTSTVYDRNVKSEADLLGKSDLDFFESAKAEIYLAQEKEVMDSGKPLLNAGESYVRSDTGQPQWVETNKLPLPDSRGNIIGLVGLIRNVTTWKLAEQRLRESEEHYRLLFDNNPLPMWVFDLETLAFLSVNESAIIHYGYSRAEFMSMTIKDIRPPEDTPALLTTVAEPGTGRRKTGLWRHRKKDGSLIEVEVFAHDLPFAGRPSRLILANDVTERLRAQSALQAYSARLAVLAEASQTLAASGTNSRAVFESVGRIAAEKLGASCIVRLLSDDGQWLEAVTNYDPNPAFHDEVLAIFAAGRISLNDPNPAAQVVRTGQPVLMAVIDPESLRHSLSPKLWAAFERFRPHSAVTASLNVQGRSIGVLSFVRYRIDQPAFTQDDLQLTQDLADRAALAITNIRLFEQVERAKTDLELRVAERTADLVQANADLLQARQAADKANAAKSEFLSRMSHELRTPLNAILGFAQLMEMRNHDGDSGDGIEHILVAGRHLLSLIDEILDISRIESGKLSISPEPVLVSQSVADAVDLVGGLADKCQVQLQVTPFGSHYVMADPRRLRQVLVNLITNAIKYNQPGGQVFIDSLEQPNQHLRIRVRDTGSGIEADKIPQLFVPFERLGAEHGPVEGTGLGLALSLQLVEAMQGSIGVESQVGQGSTFWFELPLTEEPPQLADPLPKDPSALESVATSTFGHILYIEDNPSNVRLVRAILNLRPAYQLVTAATGEAGWAQIQAQRPDLILLDLNLPDMHGADLLARLQAHPALHSIPVVVISADATLRQSQRLMAAGARAYLGKPINVAELLALTDTILK